LTLRRGRDRVGAPGSPWSEGGGPPRALVRRGLTGLTDREEPGAGGPGWWCFENPVGVLRADRVDQVPGVLAGVERGAADGLWAVGFVGYEAAPAFDAAFHTHLPMPGTPLAWFGLFGAPTAVELAAGDPGAAMEIRVRDLTPTLSDDAYLDSVRAVRELIARGETYQANLTYRLRGRLEACAPDRIERDEPAGAVRPREALPLCLFRHLARLQGGAYSAFVELDDLAVCSASPELFFERAGRSVVCRPMKGTAPRGTTAADDRAAAEALRASPKERAENLMIVDMIRNDLGRIARPGSVEVRELFRVERYPTLFQMTSQVAAVTDAPLSALFGALFPCASITGAPKVRTMDILAGLETTPRGIYTGAMGYVTPGGDARFSVAIRTALARPDGAGPGLALEYGTGSGIVWDSVPERELEETRTKALILQAVGDGLCASPELRSLLVDDTGEDDGNQGSERSRRQARPPEEPELELLETLLWRPPTAAPELRPRSGFPARGEPMEPPAPTTALPDERGFVLLGRHLERLTRSAGELGFALDPARVRQSLDALERRLSSGHALADHRVRLLVDRAGGVRTEAVSCRPSSRSRILAEAAEPINGEEVLLRHKTTGRGIYERALERTRRDVPKAALACGLLPGTFRAELLARGVVREARLPRSALARASRIAVVSSVRGWVPARLARAVRAARLDW